MISQTVDILWKRWRQLPLAGKLVVLCGGLCCVGFGLLVVYAVVELVLQINSSVGPAMLAGAVALAVMIGVLIFYLELRGKSPRQG